jgi:hypothetical protein
MSENKLTIKIITWNMGKSSKKKLDWNLELDKWTIISPSSDLIFISIQESTKSIGEGEILLALQRKLPDYDVHYKGRGTDIIGLSYYVLGYLCVKKSLPSTVINRPDDVVCIYKKMFCTKSSLGFGITIGNARLIFVCSHLPIDFSDTYLDNYGYTERIEAIRTIKTEIINKIAEVIGPPTSIFWAGDLNFRIQVNGVEQLEKLLANELSDYAEHSKEFLQTSKYIEFNSRKKGYKTFVRQRNSTIREHKYNMLRIPSYCDRIIYRGGFTSLRYYSWPPKNKESSATYPISIAYSDHTPVVLEGFINI